MKLVQMMLNSRGSVVLMIFGGLIGLHLHLGAVISHLLGVPVFLSQDGTVGGVFAEALALTLSVVAAAIFFAGAFTWYREEAASAQDSN